MSWFIDLLDRIAAWIASLFGGKPPFTPSGN
jgi:hypothetical protein